MNRQMRNERKANQHDNIRYERRRNYDDTEDRKRRVCRAANIFFVDHIIESMMDFSTDLAINYLSS